MVSSYKRYIRRRSATVVVAALFLSMHPPHVANAQAIQLPVQLSRAGEQSRLDSLTTRAIAVSPMLNAARLRVDGARARVGPAGARPDPVLMAGIQNLPLGREAMTSATPLGATTPTGGPDPMTMHMVGVSQTIPYPGKRSLRSTVAQHDVAAALVAVTQTRLGVIHDVRAAYYELAYIDQALRIIGEQHAVLGDIMRVTEAHYAAGAGMQQDVLKARIEATRLGDDANALLEQRRAHVAALNALLDQPSDAPVEQAAIPEWIARAAVPDSTSRIRFTSDALGAPAADSPLPSLQALQSTAIDNSPMLKEHEARIAAQGARVALAEKETKPDIDLSLQYGQRSGFTDMVTAVVSVPIPIQRQRKQAEDVAAARAELAALEAEHHAQVNELRARIARLYSDLERQRTQLALDVKAIIPQGRAAFAATTASYQAGKTDIVALLDARSTLFSYELSYYRLLSDFATTLADLEQVIGKEVLP